MAESTRRVAHFSYVEEVDVTALEELRASLNAAADEARPKLTMLPFLMLAHRQGGRRLSRRSTRITTTTSDVIRRFGAVHLGIATQTPAGLDRARRAPRRDARPLRMRARDEARHRGRARRASRAREELSGSTITLTSLGALGGIVSTPVVNRPEVAIVGVNKIVVKPVWRDGGFVPRKTMNLSSSFDHRVVDGYDAASFIQRLRALLEQPASLLLASRERERPMNELRCKVLDHRRRPRRLCRGDPRRPARPRHHPRRSRAARRDLPQRRLHSVEGAHPRRRRVPRARRRRSALARDRHGAPRRRARLRADHRLEGRHRLAPDRRRRRAAEEGRRAQLARPRDAHRRQDARSSHADTGEQRIRCEHLILATGSEPTPLAGAAVRRRRPVFDRGAGADRACRARSPSSAPAISGSSSAWPSPSSACRVTVVEALRSHPAALRRRADAAGRAPPRRPRRRGRSRRARARFRRRRRCASPNADGDERRV